MKNILNITKNDITLHRIKTYNDKIIDLSGLTLFEAAKTIIKSSTYGINKKDKCTYKYKVTPNVKILLSEIPISHNIELVS